MIKKLRQKIFWIIMLSLLIVTLGIIIFSAYLNYSNVINSRISMMDKFEELKIRKNINEKPELNLIKQNMEFDIEGLYEFVVEDSKIIKNTNFIQDKKIEEYAIKISKKDKESGIIGDYIYKVRKTNENTIHITLMEDTNAILHIKKVMIVCIMMLILLCIAIYIIAKKVSRIIVKPVEENFEKQKQFISDASHELKTPLAVIEANADVLENEIGTNKWLNYIQNEIESMNKLINELLLLAKIENVEVQKQYDLFNLSIETEIIVSMFESVAYEKNIKINSNIKENIIITADKEDIKHILSTFLDNAINHTDKGNLIIVELIKEKNEIIINVKNQGNPIPDEEKQKIFERFYRLDKARNRSEKRYGLGLAIAKSIVEKYNGKISVNNEDEFTVFKVNLPIN